MQDANQLILVIAAGLFVIALIALAAWGIKAFFSGSSGGPGFLRSRERRLALVESYAIDAKRKLMLIRRDDKEHLLMIGGPVDILVETGIVGRRPLEHPLEDVVIDRNDRHDRYERVETLRERPDPLRERPEPPMTPRQDVRTEPRAEPRPEPRQEVRQEPQYAPRPAAQQGQQESLHPLPPTFTPVDQGRG